MQQNFTAIDFETAQGKRWSICQVGLVRVEEGEITKKINLLVQPPDNYYFYKNIEIHGISPEQTANEPQFPVIWQKIKPYIQNQTVVAHNGAFDFNCLYQTLEYYNLPHPTYHQQCTLKIYGSPLAYLCDKYKIELNHHDALSDAMACGELYLMYLDEKSESNNT